MCYSHPDIVAFGASVEPTKVQRTQFQSNPLSACLLHSHPPLLPHVAITEGMKAFKLKKAEGEKRSERERCRGREGRKEEVREGRREGLAVVPLLAIRAPGGAVLVIQESLQGPVLASVTVTQVAVALVEDDRGVG